MNVVIALAHRGVSVAQWLEHWSAESEGLRFVFSWGIRIFSLSHVRDKTKKHLSLLIILLFSSQSILSDHNWKKDFINVSELLLY